MAKNDNKLSPLYMGCMLFLCVSCLAVIIFLLIHYISRGVASFCSNKEPLYAKPFSTPSDWY